MKRAICLFGCILAMSIAGWGQEVTAGIYGTVQDSSSAGIPWASITMLNTETGRRYQTTADESGNFTFTLIPIGAYEVTAEAAGFKKSTIKNVTLRVNDNRRIGFGLDVGQLTESITVEASAVTVNTASGATSAVLDGGEMVKYPSRGRYVMPFALLMPGAISTTPYDRRNNNTSVNGIRPTHNAWLLDGGYNIDTGGNWGVPLAPNIETVAEFRAIRGNYNAEFGIGGGSQFNVITKSGTNQLHGSAYEFLRNDKLNARNYFAPTRQPFKGNDFGFTVGGPVYIPKVYNGRDKTFFFAQIGWIKERREERFLQKIPELAYRAGDFSGLGKTIIDPLTGQAFPDNMIPSARFDKNALGYTRMYPAPNYRDSAGRNFTSTNGRADNTDERMFRADHNFSEKHRIMGRYTHELRTAAFVVDPGFSFLRRNDRTPADNTAANFTSTFRPNLINDFNFVRSHNRIMQFPPDVSGATWGISIPKLVQTTEANYPLTSLNLSRIPDKVPNVSFANNYGGVAPSAPWSNYQTIYDLKDNLTWIKGTHTVKFGFDYAYEIKFEPTNTNVFGDFTFDGKFTGDAWADFLLGKAASYEESNTVGFNDNRRHAFESYVDDLWKATRRLTLNFGVRHSFFPPAYEASDKYRVFRPDNYDPAKAVTVNASGQVVRNSGDRLNGLVNPVRYWKNSLRNFAPRFSFAYDVGGKGRTAVRGGYGIFYSREILGAFILMSGNPPFAELLSIFNPQLSNPGGGQARDYDLPITLGSIDTHQLTPYTQQWNFNVQRGLTGNMVLEIGYSGSRAIHMMRTQDLNQPLANAGIASGVVNANALRPYKGWGVLNHREQSYMSNYHGLQTSLSRTFARGFGTQIAYTWSKAIDNADFTGGIYGFVPNTRDSRPERGRANFDATHNFIASYIWDIPWLKSRHDLAGRVVGGWQFSGITTFQTGLPINPQLGKDIAGVGTASRQRPATTGSPFVDHGSRTVNRWFDPAVYYAPALGTFALTGRNILSGPGTNNWDFSLAKNVALKERSTLEIRLDAFNVFNHTQFSVVGQNFFTPSSFGKVTASRYERSMMAGLRLAF